MNHDVFYIELLEEHEKVNLYSIRLENEEITEAEKFFRTFEQEKAYARDLETILYFIDKIAENGALERYFRISESKMRDGVCAIPIETSKLRLYCLRLSDNVLIIGNGGIKDKKTYNEIPALNKTVKLLSDLDSWMKHRIEQGKLSFSGKEIKGSLRFFIKNK